MWTFSKNYSIAMNYLLVLLPTLSIASCFANELPPIGERVYLGSQDGKYGSLEIQKKPKKGKKSEARGVIFRDPELDLDKVKEPKKTIVVIEEDHNNENNKNQKIVKQSETKKKDMMNSRQPGIGIGELEEKVLKQEKTRNNRKSILDLGALKISGRHKEPTIPFNKIPIHLEQSHEPLNKNFLNQIHDNLPGL
ncbi:MAG: hypothetical protein AB8G05_11180 [Oligoflexales bacterium]